MPTILLIEDDDTMLNAIRIILCKDGHNVIIARDGIEAFDMLDNAEFDAVITDLKLPYANGLDIIARLRSNSKKRHVGIIVISLVNNEETVVEAFKLGADDYLKKPIMAGELLIRTRKLFSGKHNGSQVVTKKK